MGGWGSGWNMREEQSPFSELIRKLNWFKNTDLEKLTGLIKIKWFEKNYLVSKKLTGLKKDINWFEKK